MAAVIIKDITINGVSSPNCGVEISKTFIPISEPTKTGPKIVPRLFAAPNFPIPEDLSSSEVTSATYAPDAGLDAAPIAELIILEINKIINKENPVKSPTKPR